MNQKNKFMLAAVLLALLLTVAVSGSLAYLIDLSGPVENVFTPGSVPPEVTEKFEGNVKKEVKIKNTGNVSAYIRAMVIVTWETADGEVLGVTPIAGTDYAIDYTKAGWTEPDENGFYYYNNPVAPGGVTGVLFTNCQPLQPAPAEGYTLHVEIITQSVQSEGMGATSAQDAFVKAKQ